MRYSQYKTTVDCFLPFSMFAQEKLQKHNLLKNSANIVITQNYIYSFYHNYIENGKN